jgi:hypothetical protein
MASKSYLAHTMSQVEFLIVVCTLQFGYYEQVGTNPGCQVTVVTKFCMVAPNICGSSVWNLVDIALLAPEFRADFWIFGKCLHVRL